MDDFLLDEGSRRITTSFIVVAILHFMALYGIQVDSLRKIEDAKLITNVEILKPPSLEPIEAHAPEPEKNIWEKFKEVIPLGKSEPTEDIRPMDSMKQLLQNTVAKPDRSPKPLSMNDKSELEDLKKLRDEKLDTLMGSGSKQKIARMMAQEQILTEAAAPLVRPAARMGGADSISIDEVGMSKIENLADVMKKVKKQKKSAFAKTGSVQKLVEKKADLKQRLASLGVKQSIQMDKDRDVRGSRQQLKEVVGSVKERQRVQEVLAIQRLIEEKEPSRPAPPTAFKGGGLGRSGFQGMQSIQMSDPNEGVRERQLKKVVPDPGALQRMKQAAGRESVAEIKSSPVEITGPLQNRKVISAFVPPYPAWAKRQGVEADVSLQFSVDSQGRVLDGTSIVRTSGYRELDLLCVEYLKKWSFAPLSSGDPQQEQWGVITIRFRLE